MVQIFMKFSGNVGNGLGNRGSDFLVVIRITVWIREFLKDCLALQDWSKFNICVYTSIINHPFFLEK